MEAPKALKIHQVWLVTALLEDFQLKVSWEKFEQCNPSWKSTDFDTKKYNQHQSDKKNLNLGVEIL